MNKFPAISLLLLVAGIALAAYCSRELSHQRVAMYKSNPERLKVVHMPILGLDKFWSDLQWIRLIQKLGDASNGSVAADDEAAKRLAEYYCRQCDFITLINPDFTVIYQVGVMNFCNILPDKALELMDRGDKLSNIPDWKRAYYSSVIVDRYIGAVAKDAPTKEKAAVRSRNYLQKIVEKEQNYPFYIETSLMRKIAQIRKIDPNDPLATLKAKKMYYDSKIEALRKSMISANIGMAGAPGTSGAVPPPPGGAMPPADAAGMLGQPMDDLAMQGGMMGGEDESNLSKLRNHIMQQCQGLALETWRSQVASTNPEEKKALKGKRATIKEIFLAVAPKGGHYAPISLVTYEPGELFDSNTGTRLKPYGMDYQYYKTTKNVVLLHGKFSHVTGMPVDKAEANDVVEQVDEE